MLQLYRISLSEFLVSQRASDPDIACQTFCHTTQTPFNLALSSNHVLLARPNPLPLEQTGVLVGIRGLESVDAMN